MRANAPGPGFLQTDSCRSSTEIDPMVRAKCGAEDRQFYAVELQSSPSLRIPTS
jgi:hypothetical protein